MQLSGLKRERVLLPSLFKNLCLGMLACTWLACSPTCRDLSIYGSLLMHNVKPVPKTAGQAARKLLFWMHKDGTEFTFCDSTKVTQRVCV